MHVWGYMRFVRRLLIYSVRQLRELFSSQLIITWTKTSYFNRKWLVFSKVVLTQFI